VWCPQELLYPGIGEGHNWRSIIFSLLVIGLVISGIVTAIYLLGYVDELLYWSGRRMKLEELLAGDFASEKLTPSWVSARHFVFQTDDGSLSVLDTNNGSVSLLVTNHTLVSTFPNVQFPTSRIPHLNFPPLEAHLNFPRLVLNLNV